MSSCWDIVLVQIFGPVLLMSLALILGAELGLHPLRVFQDNFLSQQRKNKHRKEFFGDYFKYVSIVLYHEILNP